jgi:hypothetical protein
VVTSLTSDQGAGGTGGWKRREPGEELREAALGGGGGGQGRGEVIAPMGGAAKGTPRKEETASEMVPRMGPEVVTIVGVGVEEVVRGRGREREQTKRARAQASCSDAPRASMALLFVWGFAGVQSCPKRTPPPSQLPRPESQRHALHRAKPREHLSISLAHALSFPLQPQLQREPPQAPSPSTRLLHTFKCVIVS